MEKLLIGLSVPAINWSVDMFVPQSISVAELKEVLAQSVTELSGGRYCSSGEELLTLKEPPMLLDPNYTLEAYGIRDGSRLVLF